MLVFEYYFSTLFLARHASFGNVTRWHYIFAKQCLATKILTDCYRCQPTHEDEDIGPTVVISMLRVFNRSGHRVISGKKGQKSFKKREENKTCFIFKLLQFRIALFPECTSRGWRNRANTPLNFLPLDWTWILRCQRLAHTIRNNSHVTYGLYKAQTPFKFRYLYNLPSVIYRFTERILEHS